MSENTQTVVERANALSAGWCQHTDGEAWRATGFIEGATFAATITPEQVEAAARAIFRANDGIDWDLAERDHAQYREDARAALTAAGFQIEADR